MTVEKEASIEAAIAYDHYVMLPEPKSMTELLKRMKESFPVGIKIPTASSVYRWRDEFKWDERIRACDTGGVQRRLHQYREHARSLEAVDMDIMAVTRHFESNSVIASLAGEIILEVLPLLREKMVKATKRLVIPENTTPKDLASIYSTFRGIIETARKAQEMGLEEEGLQRVLEEMEVL